MRVILTLLRVIFYLIAFVAFTLVALRFTLDVESLSPEITNVISKTTGAEVEVKGLKLEGVLGLSIATMDLVFPYSPERKKEWEEYDTYLKKRDLAKRENTPVPEPVPEPLPMLNLCVHNTRIDIDVLSLWSFVAGGDIEGSLTTNLFECRSYDDPPQPSSLGLLKAQFKAPIKQEDGDVVGRKAQGNEVQLKFNLSELNLETNELLIDQSPVKLAGILSLVGDTTLQFGPKGKFQLRQSEGSFELEVNGLQNDKGMMTVQTPQGPVPLELPKLNLGQLNASLKLERGGRLMFQQFEAKSADLDLKITGNLSLSMVLARIGVNTHIALNIMPDLIRNSSDVKNTAEFGSRMFRKQAHIKKQSDGGYEIGVLLNGKLSKPRATSVAKSPYGKDGKKVGRSAQDNNRVQSNSRRRSQATRANTKRPSRQPPRTRIQPNKRANKFGKQSNQVRNNPTHRKGKQTNVPRRERKDFRKNRFKNSGSNENFNMDQGESESDSDELDDSETGGNIGSDGNDSKENDGDLEGNRDQEGDGEGDQEGDGEGEGEGEEDDE